MAVSPFLGRDGLFHSFTFITLHTARIYNIPTSQDPPVPGRRIYRRWITRSRRAA